MHCLAGTFVPADAGRARVLAIASPRGKEQMPPRACQRVDHLVWHVEPSVVGALWVDGLGIQRGSKWASNDVTKRLKAQ